MPQYIGSCHNMQPIPVISYVEHIMLQVIEGLSFMHGQDLIHRDIKPDNILIKRRSPLEVALSDHGWTASLHNPEMLTGPCGTLGFSAPEDSRAGVLHTKAVDVFSLGATFFAVQAPDSFKNNSHVGVLANVGIHPPQHYSSLVQKMMAEEPDARP